jgi:polyisoprenoid-binding protein YceI
MKKIICFFVIALAATPLLTAQIQRKYADKTYSYIKYYLSHPLHEVEATSTDQVCVIDIDISQKQIKAALVQVGVASFNSGNSNRDSHAMEVVNAIQYPAAKFLSDKIEQNGDSLKISGKLTFHGVTKEIYINAVQKWEDKNMEIDGGFDISLTEFKIDRPTLLLMPVSDDLKFSFKEFFNL